MPPLAAGDLVAFRSAGAYGAVMASEYNSRPLVPEVLVKGDHFAVIRPRPTFDEMIARDTHSRSGSARPDWAQRRRRERPADRQRPQTPDASLAHLRWPLRLTRARPGRRTRAAGLLAGLDPFSPVARAAALRLAGQLAASRSSGRWRSCRTVGLLGGPGLGRDARSAGRPGPRRWPASTHACPAGRSRPSRDSQAIGAGDPASEAVWQAHQARMAERTRARQARSQPDLRLAARDPFGLRYVALLLFVCGAALRLGLARRHGRRDRRRAAARRSPTGPVWEGWIEPPAYTGKPSLYLADIPAGPAGGARGQPVTLRLYGEVGALTVDETVSGRTGRDPARVGPAAELSRRRRTAGSPSTGEGGATWERHGDPRRRAGGQPHRPDRGRGDGRDGAAVPRRPTITA